MVDDMQRQLAARCDGSEKAIMASQAVGDIVNMRFGKKRKYIEESIDDPYLSEALRVDCHSAGSFAMSCSGVLCALSIVGSFVSGGGAVASLFSMDGVGAVLSFLAMITFPLGLVASVPLFFFLRNRYMNVMIFRNAEAIENWAKTGDSMLADGYYLEDGTFMKKLPLRRVW